jgi:peptidoglycan L-alanyl-D-glutamate endopeptidase CwlK
MNDAISNQRLALCMPALVAKVNAAANLLAMNRVYCRVDDALRTYAEQDAEFAKGPAFTRARGGYSAHNFGMAVDCVPFLIGTTGALDWNPKSDKFQMMVAAMKKSGLEWGGDWVHMHGDFDHFYIGPATPTDADRQAFAKGGLPAVWQLYPQE